jgi:RNA methyltransferase, TrmH family
MASPELPIPGVPGMREARRLAARAFRAERRRFLVEGPQAVREALVAAGSATGRPLAPAPVVHRLWWTDRCLQRNPELARLASAAGVVGVEITESVLAQIGDTVTPQGVLAVCDFLPFDFTALLSSSPRLIAMLAQVRDPGNAGTVIRCADAAGADAALLSAGSVDAYNPKAVRAAAGSHFHLPVGHDLGLEPTLTALRAAGLTVLAADGGVRGAVDLDTAADTGLLARPVVWLFGNEAWGLPASDRALADEVVAVPLYGRAESLNLATAAAVCLYATARAQRRG